MHQLIPHQLGLAKTQVKKVLMGQPITIPYKNMGSSAGEHVIMLNPMNAQKLLTGYKKGKGIRMKLEPEEIEETVKMGRGFVRPKKSIKDTIHIDVLSHANEKDGEGLQGYGLQGGRLKKGSQEARAFMESIRQRKAGGNLKDFKKAVVDTGRNVAKYAIPIGTSAVGGVAGEIVGGPVGAIVGSTMGKYAGKEINESIGLGMKKRGRPSKVGGALASSSKAYQKALQNNFDGLVLNNASINNEKISNFKVNPRVRPSSDQMTLSPYARMDSPAMNPFIPKTSVEVGGTSNGYGGKGLYGYSR